MATTDVINREDKPNPFKVPATIDLGPSGGNVATQQIINGVGRTENPDGSLSLDFAPKVEKKDGAKSGWFDNLADEIDAGELSRIASELLEGITLDDQSRRDWLETRARGIALLGLKLNEPKGEATSEGVSTVQHPLLLEAVLRFQANARGELLPAAGPIKIRNDAPVAPDNKAPPTTLSPTIPQPPQSGQMSLPPNAGGMPPGAMPPSLPPAALPPGAPHPMVPMGGGGQQMPGMGGGPPPGPPGSAGQQPSGNVPPPPTPTGMMAPPSPVRPGAMSSAQDELAEALETDLNHWITAVATEYYPDTDRMLFWIGAGGQGIKKVYNCPIRRRPVSESIDAEDLIVSNAETNLENCGRITHRIKMRPSVLKRMQIAGWYRDVELHSAGYELPDPVKEKKKEIQGIVTQAQRPQDAEHEIFECYCELDIAGFEHKSKGGKITGLQLPYVVTIHKESRQILSLRRNWRKDDKMCLAREHFVDFAFVRALGFYGIGLIHILGNTTSALTAAWRIQLDAGMFNCFPGFIYAKQFGRQLTNQFRIAPGTGIAIDTGTLRVQDAVMPLPYKEPGSAFMQLTQNIEQLGQRVGGTAEIAVGEGKQEAPVGTTLALIEQSTKTMDAVHKRLTAAQAKEFQLLKDRFREDPEAFWRHSKRLAANWEEEQFIEALEDNNLVPVSDPNNPTSMHRIAKAVVIKQLQAAAPELYDPIAVDTRIFRITGIDPEGLFRATPAPPPPNPNLIAAQAKQEANKMQMQSQQLQGMLKMKIAEMQSNDKAQDRQSKERLEQMKIMHERLKIQEEAIIHKNESAHDMHMQALDMIMDHHHNAAKNQQDMALKQQQAEADMQRKQQETALDQHMKTGGMVMDLQHQQHKQQGELELLRQKHEQTMQMEREKHEHALELERERQRAELEHEKQTSKIELKHKRNMDRQDRTTKRQEIQSKERIAKIGADAQIKVAKMKPKPSPTGGKKKS